MHKVTVPMSTMLEADSLMEKAIRVGLDAMVEVEFTYNCGACDDIHQRPMTPVMLMGLALANVEIIAEFVAKDQDNDSLMLYKTIFKHLFRNNIANAEILVEELVRQAEKDCGDNPLLEQVGAVMIPEIGEWKNNGATD